MSPTEEEFDEAQRAGVAVLALVQEGVEREPDQQAFVARVSGTWESGRFAPSFTDASDVVPAVVRALNDWRSAAPSAEQARAAGERVQTFARGPERDGEMQSGSKLRVVADALRAHCAEGRLEPEELEHRLAMALTACTREALERLVQDLPRAPRTPGPGSAAERGRRRIPAPARLAVPAGSGRRHASR